MSTATVVLQLIGCLGMLVGGVLVLRGATDRRQRLFGITFVAVGVCFGAALSLAAITR